MSDGRERQERLTARVRGRVQGVGFRWWARSTAGRLGLSGWVRNLDDELTVELLAEGPAEAIDRLQAELRQGPPGARIDDVEARRGPASGGYTGFEIRR